MKQFLLLFLLAIFTANAWSQTPHDQASILKKCIELPELQKFYPKGNDGIRKPIVIIGYPVSFSEYVQEQMDITNTLFYTRDKLTQLEKPAHFAFRQFSYDSVKATIRGNYFFSNNDSNKIYSTVFFNIDFKKSGAEWLIINSLIKEETL